jgi:hypothetical protein
MSIANSRRKSRLTPLQKSLVAAKAVLDAASEGSEAKAIGQHLRETVGLNWSLITAAQYLTGQGAIVALKGLPDNYRYESTGKVQLLAALVLAHDLCANLSPSGTALSGGLHVENFRRGA